MSLFEYHVAQFFSEDYPLQEECINVLFYKDGEFVCGESFHESIPCDLFMKAVRGYKTILDADEVAIKYYK